MSIFKSLSSLVGYLFPRKKRLKFCNNCIEKRKQVEMSLKENLNFLQTLIDTIPYPLFYKDEHGVYKLCNTALSEFLGLKKEGIVNHTVYEVYPEELAEIYNNADNELMNRKGKQTYESQIMYNDGSFHDVIFSKAALKNEQEQVKGLVGVVVDITERKNAEKRIQRLLNLKEAMLEVNQAVIGIKNIKELYNLILDKIIEVMDNAELACVMLLDEDENLKIAAHKGYDSEESKKYTLKLRESFFWLKTKGKPEKSVIINDIQGFFKEHFPNLLDNQNDIKIQSSISAPIIIDGKLYGLVNIDSSHNNVYDKTDLEMMEYLRNQITIALSKHMLYEETIYLSRYDKLTNVYNRRYFEELFDTYIDKAVTNNEEFLFVLFDLNGLKLVNDTYGHLAGDKLIETFTSKLRDLIEESDILARYGGDEFVAVFSHTDSQILNRKFEDLIKYFNNNPMMFEENNIICSFSYGIANFPNDGIKYSELVKISDERMYQFKKEIKRMKKPL